MLKFPFVWNVNCELCVLCNHSVGMLSQNCTLGVLFIPVVLSLGSLVGFDPSPSNDISVPDVFLFHSNASCSQIRVCLCFAVPFCTIGLVVFVCYWTSPGIAGKPLVAE